MSFDNTALKLCNCNRTMTFDAGQIARALKLGAPPVVHTELCRRQIASFDEALGGDACLVACTQEASLFAEVAEQSEG